MLFWIHNSALKHDAIKIKAPTYKNIYCIIICDSKKKKKKTGNNLDTHK